MIHFKPQMLGTPIHSHGFDLRSIVNRSRMADLWRSYRTLEHHTIFVNDPHHMWSKWMRFGQHRQRWRRRRRRTNTDKRTHTNNHHHMENPGENPGAYFHSAQHKTLWATTEKNTRINSTSTHEAHRQWASRMLGAVRPRDRQLFDRLISRVRSHRRRCNGSGRRRARGSRLSRSTLGNDVGLTDWLTDCVCVRVFGELRGRHDFPLVAARCAD